jgi:hypothetical protein
LRFTFGLGSLVTATFRNGEYGGAMLPYRLLYIEIVACDQSKHGWFLLQCTISVICSYTITLLALLCADLGTIAMITHSMLGLFVLGTLSSEISWLSPSMVMCYYNLCYVSALVLLLASCSLRGVCRWCLTFMSSMFCFGAMFWRSCHKSDDFWVSGPIMSVCFTINL